MLTFQRLEPRLPLAGNVSVSLQNGGLRIQGDTAANYVIVEFDHPTGLVRVAGHDLANSPTTLTVNGRRVAEATFAGVSSINATMGRGSDWFTFKGDQVGFTTYPLRLQSISVNLGIGDNFLQGLDTTSTDGLTVRGGSGDDSVVLTNCIFAGASDISLAGGDDGVDLRGVAFSSLSVNLGGGADDFVSESFSDNSPGCFFDGNLSIAMEGGSDGVRIQKTQVRGTLSCNLGGGEDQFRLRGLIGGTTVVGTYAVDGGTQRDSLFLEANAILPAGFFGFEVTSVG